MQVKMDGRVTGVRRAMRVLLAQEAKRVIAGKQGGRGLTANWN